MLSDDSHGPHAVGHNYDKLRKYLRGMQVTDIWFLERCEEGNSAGRHVRGRKVEGNWWSDPFWTISATP